MSQNQIRGKEYQYRKTGVVGGARQNNSSDYQQRPLSGGSGTAPSLSSNAPASRSFKKSNNGQGGGSSKGNSGLVNSSLNPNPTTGARPVENGSHVQSTVSGVSHKPAWTAVPKPADDSSQKSSQPVSKAQLSQTPSMTPDSTSPTTPSKGDAGKGFPLLFGSISAGFMNGMQVPARTSSAPPNLDEQLRNQALRTASRDSHANAAPSAPKQQMPNLDGSAEKPTPQEPHIGSKTTRDVPLISAPPPVQAQKHTIVPMAMQFPQPNGPIAFGGPNPQLPSQGIRANSHQIPIPMPLPVGNPNQVQQPVFVPGLQHHVMPNQGIIHQGPNFGFNPGRGHQLPHQPGNLGMNMSPQLSQQAGKFNSGRKTVKITHPETHEELKLDNKNGGSSGARVNHITNPQSQPIPTYTAPRPGGFYTNSYTSPYIPPSSLPLTSSSLAPRFTYSGQGPPVMPYMSMGAVSVPGRPELSNMESLRSAPHVRPSTHTLPVSTPPTVRPVGSSVGDSNPASSSPPLKSQSDSTKQSYVFVPSSTNTDADDKETATGLNSSCGTQEQSGVLKGVLPTSSQVTKDNDIDDKLAKDQLATEHDSHLESVTKDHSEGRQSNNQFKTTDVFTKQPDHKPGLVEASQTETAVSYGSGIETPPHPGNLPETNVECEAEVIESARQSSSSGIASGEPNKTKNNKGKKKRKEMFQKAEALGTNPDLYLAYKGPNENKGSVASEEIVADLSVKEVSITKLENGTATKTNERKKPELENWEDVADGSTPKLKSSDNMTTEGFFQDDDEGAVKKYSRDFLLTISEQCSDLPEGFQSTPDIADVLMRLNVVNDSRDYSSAGRSSGAARHDRRGNGSVDVDRWGKPNPHLSGRDPGIDIAYAGNLTGFRPGQGANYGVMRQRGQGPVQHGVGILPGLMHSMSFQGTPRNNHEGDRWQRATNFTKALMPSPQPVMHRAENKYEVGKVSDEEQAKQRRLKAILNKLTPQNFEKLFEQVKEVKIDNVVTLSGVISQIFDKALMEPTFCEMYANFCQHLASELPDLTVDNQKITFRRLLLNKCQEEFERGEREEEEVNNDEGETKQSDQEREDKRLKVRRRMLGNIRLIGELYKKRMLTERIMHECIKKLLGHYQNADEENIEALCKLMSTIGEMIDHPKAKDHMDAYFEIMRQLSKDMKLSSRVRFMLKDTIDLRKNRWQQRRKVEGPKKIEEVHRAAAQERLGQTSRLTRGPSMNSSMRRGPPLEYAPRAPSSSQVGQGGGYRGVTPQSRGHVGQDARIDDKNEFESKTFSAPLLQRSSGDEPIMLGPQGGLAKGMSSRGQPSGSTGLTADNSSSHGDVRRGASGLNGYSSQGDQFPKQGMPVSNDSSPQERNSNATQKMLTEKVDAEERLQERSMAAIKEYYSAKDVKEAELCIKELNAPSFYPTLISMWVTDAFERKDMERNVLTKLLVSLTKPTEGTFNPQQLIQGFESLLAVFEDTVTDAPRAPEFLGRMFGVLVLENVLPLQDVCRLIHQGGEEPGRLLEVGLAADVLGSILETIKSETSDITLNEIRTSSNLRLEDYLPPQPLKSRKLEMFL